MKKKNLLLGLMPYWSPLIPPQGVAQLKVYAEKHGHRVKTFDANVEPQFREIYQLYFTAIKKYVPEDNWGNLYNIGHDVLRNHMMAHFNYMNDISDETTYYQLIEEIIYQTFFVKFNPTQISEMDDYISRFYNKLLIYIKDLLDREKPDFFGLTAHLGTLSADMFTYKSIKELTPQVITMVGGSIFAGELPMASPDFETLLEKAPYIDKIVVGEGERLMLKIVEGEFPDNKRVFTIADTKEPRLELSTIQLPDHSDFEMERYPYNAAFVSKSCPFKCRFCNVEAFFGEFRHKDIKQSVDQLEELYKRDGFQLIHLLDSLVNPFITELSQELIRREMSMYMDAYLRVSDEVCDPEKTLLWRKGGLYRTRLGIESGSPKLLKMMGKEITVEQSKAALASLAQAGIKTTTYIVIGFPGETEEDFQQTLDFIEEMKNNIWQMECNPFYYFYTGQQSGDTWADKRRLLYPESAEGLLLPKTWILQMEPSREERFERMFRLVRHCKKLGIPNPYTPQEYFEADERWKSLHENAVPSLVDFRNAGEYITENRYVKRLVTARRVAQEDGDFSF